MIMVIITGSMCGFVVAAIHAVHFHVWHSMDRTLLSTNTACAMPEMATTITMRTNDDNDTEFQLAVWNDGDFLTESILNNGFWEILDISGLAELGNGSEVLPTDSKVFWDIGANIGYYSFLFAAAGYDVVAVEPELRNAELLKTSLCLNPELRQRIQLVQTAVSNEANRQKQQCKMIATTKAKRMKQYLHLIPKLSCDETTTCRGKHICQDTPVTTLDELLRQRYKAPSVLKLDVEGHENAVLQGASQLLSSKEPPKFIQYENKDVRVEADIRHLLEQHGYVVGTERGHDSNTVAVHQSSQ